MNLSEQLRKDMLEAGRSIRSLLLQEDTDLPVIYFIACEPGPIKIGKTTARGLKGRFAGLQTSCPFELKLCRVSYGDLSVELVLHRMFAGYRLKGEWFKRNDELELLMDSLEAPDWEPRIVLSSGTLGSILMERSKLSTPQDHVEMRTITTLAWKRALFSDLILCSFPKAKEEAA